MPNPVVHFEIQAQDGKAAQEFYAKLFDWHVDSSNPMNYGLVDTHTGEGIGGGITGTEGPNQVTVYVQVDDLQAYLDKVGEYGRKDGVAADGYSGDGDDGPVHGPAGEPGGDGGGGDASGVTGKSPVGAALG